MIRRPPRSPLFPYPPLFRSVLGAEMLRHLRRVRALFRVLAGESRREGLDLAVLAARQREQHARVEAAGEERDRKSTRLNSSHANISYAVFCLKKKKKTQITL